MKKIKTILSSVIICALVISFTACSVKVQAADLMSGIVANKVTPVSDLKSGNEALSHFAVSTFSQVANDNDNALISPLSLMLALSMTANGAEGETKKEMEKVLNMSTGELNTYLYSLLKELNQDDEGDIHIANAIWFKDTPGFVANQSFLQTNADFYGAGAFKAPFDKSTADDINNWVSNKTDGMIENLVDEIPDRAIMYLVNALSFEAEWSDPYTKRQVSEGRFTNSDGTTANTDFMSQTLYGYLECENATGFIKPYKDGNFAFAALLPSENTSVSDFISSLDGQKLTKILNSVSDTQVKTSMPKFEAEYSSEMSNTFIELGMKTAFDTDKADFDSIGKARDNIYISRVLHKTFISVAEKGTRAGAAASVEMSEKSSMPHNLKTVILNRPFVYMIINLENNVPIFLGAVNNLSK